MTIFWCARLGIYKTFGISCHLLFWVCQAPNPAKDASSFTAAWGHAAKWPLWWRHPRDLSGLDVQPPRCWAVLLESLQCQAKILPPEIDSYLFVFFYDEFLLGKNNSKKTRLITALQHREPPLGFTSPPAGWCIFHLRVNSDTTKFIENEFLASSTWLLRDNDGW